MAGLNLNVGGFGGVSTTSPSSYGTASSYDSGTSAAFGPGVSIASESATSALNPGTPTGMAVFVGVAAIAALAFIRYSLPN